ncbi:polysaccharide deacetylase [Rhodopirellula maiorica SM1]|uniref:Polysaccharide deacetylase n=1 Tax=Rhodopirellula maiorica SM1 TaxID=1265738 RepID=M5RZL2_9BACT|nr:polysaccharide deacetylase family protein [Rhodopirellula maiorica]EMI20827.1 polysaccharide deacetylase [Rhodopirellula maiorica SM1]
MIGPSREENFLRHVDYCQGSFDLIGLDELQKRVDEHYCARPTLTFTFDDGYAENCDFALPLLAERKIPCVYFVAIGHVQQQNPFPHDVDAGVPLPPNTLRQLRDISDSGIEIGLHTRNHVDFSKVYDPRVVHHEVTTAKDELEQWIGRPVRYFAVPYGMPSQLTSMVIDAVYRCGMLGFCSAFGAYNTVGRDSFHIRRFHGDPCFSRMKNWLSFDPRKLRREPRVDYRLPRRRSSDHKPTSIESRSNLGGAGLSPISMPMSQIPAASSFPAAS